MPSDRELLKSIDDHLGYILLELRDETKGTTAHKVLEALENIQGALERIEGKLDALAEDE